MLDLSCHTFKHIFHLESFNLGGFQGGLELCMFGLSGEVLTVTEISREAVSCGSWPAGSPKST